MSMDNLTPQQTAALALKPRTNSADKDAPFTNNGSPRSDGNHGSVSEQDWACETHKNVTKDVAAANPRDATAPTGKTT